MFVRIFILLGVVGVSRRLGGEFAVRTKDTAKPLKNAKTKRKCAMGWSDSFVMRRVAICLTEKYSPRPWRFSAAWR